MRQGNLRGRAARAAVTRTGLVLMAGLMFATPPALAGTRAASPADAKKTQHHGLSAHHGQHGYSVGALGRKSELLHDAVDADLQRRMQRSVEKLNLAGAVKNKQLSLALVDVTDPTHPRMAMLNGDDMRYAASLPKIAILFGAFQKAHEGKLELDEQTRQEMVDMIRVSSNRAATAVLDKVGRRYLSQLLQSKRYRFYDPEMNGGLWVGKPYASGVAYHRDPLHNISHGATAFQVARFYYMLETGQLVSPESSRQMKEILGDPGIHHKFVKGLERKHPEARIYRKSGSWRHFHADSAIIERGGRRYIAVALAEHPEGGKWMQELIVEMDSLVFAEGEPVESARLETGQGALP